MASAFRSVNHGTSTEPARDSQAPPSSIASITSPTTPKPTDPPRSQPPAPSADEATTPTNATFQTNAGASGMASQRPLPSSPFPESVQMPSPAEIAHQTPKRVASQRSQRSQGSQKSKDSGDVDMDRGDSADENDDSSGDESGSQKSGKKKKSQRFYCEGYPPCHLSFTRSEHLARHIRKHTGERPFTCHCGRKFSRLDNLRQHAQTVHVNEDIPLNSLAATGTRFQRQVRTDRVRPAGQRARALTGGTATGAPARGHSKSLSTSSITSVGSIASDYSAATETRRRPPPLAMAADPRARYSMESFRGAINTGDGQLRRPSTPNHDYDFSTPTSATFSTGQSSPSRWGSGFASPVSSHSRSQSMYGVRDLSRRLSVDAGTSHYPHYMAGRTFFNPANSSNAGSFSPRDNSLLSSPTASSSGWSTREPLRPFRDSASGPVDEPWRRRTWHLDSGASRLNQVHIPSPDYPPPERLAQLPIPTPGQRQSEVRLPGIASLDIFPHASRHASQRTPSPPPRRPSPMVVDTDLASPAAQHIASADRTVLSHWDNTNLHSGIGRLDINTPPRDSAALWGHEVSQAVLAQGEQVLRTTHGSQAAARFGPEVGHVQQVNHVQATQQPSRASIPTSRHHHTMSAPTGPTPRESKRHGWYNGFPVTTVHPATETIHEGRPHVDRMMHPNMHEFQGFPARESNPPPVVHQQSAGQARERRPERERAEGLDVLAVAAGVASQETTAY